MTTHICIILEIMLDRRVRSEGCDTVSIIADQGLRALLVLLICSFRRGQGQLECHKDLDSA